MALTLQKNIKLSLIYKKHREFYTQKDLEQTLKFIRYFNPHNKKK